MSEKILQDKFEATVAWSTASTDHETRHNGVLELKSLISQIPDEVMIDWDKIWKGLYLAVWLADGREYQNELCELISSFVDEFKDPENLACYLESFYVSMCRHWTGLDKYRLDKYLYLIRCHVRRVIFAAADCGFDELSLSVLIDPLLRTILNGELIMNHQVPTALTMHIISLWLEELEKVIEDLDQSILTELLIPFMTLATQCNLPAIIRYLSMYIFDKLQDEPWSIFVFPTDLVEPVTQGVQEFEDIEDLDSEQRAEIEEQLEDLKNSGQLSREISPCIIGMLYEAATSPLTKYSRKFIYDTVAELKQVAEDNRELIVQMIKEAASEEQQEEPIKAVEKPSQPKKKVAEEKTVAKKVTKKVKKSKK